VQGTIPNTTSEVIVRGNTIGAGVDGTTNLGNIENGIHLQNIANSIIGGSDPGQGNTIAFNLRSGVVVDDSVFPGTSTGNLISRNLMFTNGGLGIELASRAPSPGDTPRLHPNDDDDTDTGANGLQNYPELTKVLRTAPDKVEAHVYLRSTPSTTFTFEFFSNTPAADTGSGETQNFLLSHTIASNAKGVIRFGVANLTLAAGDFLSLTVTDADNNTSHISQDADGDALYDSWELDGLDVNADGNVDLDLPALGVSVDRKDVLVEADYIDIFQPQPGAIQDVIDAFDLAPITNSGARPGIALHVIEDEAIPFLPAMDFFGVESSAFQTVKNTYFGTSAERIDPNAANILAAKRLVYRYAVFGKQLSPTDKSSGQGELGGNDFVVTVGSWTAPEWSAPADRRDLEAGTFMHELGHTLNLGHGGAANDEVQYKPNYLSVLNYSLQAPDIDVSRPLDYSRVELPPLDENALLEAVGVLGEPGRLSIFYVNGKTIVTPTLVPVDWNDNGVIDLTPVQVDINQDGKRTVLKGHNDWPNLEYGFRSSKGFADGAEPDVITNNLTEEAALANIAAIQFADADFDNDGFADANDNAPGIFNPDQATTNGVATVLVKKSATFLDQDGDTVTVSLKGPGEFTLVVRDDDKDLRGPIESIGTTGTTAASSLSVVVKANKVTGNGRVDAEDIHGAALKALAAGAVDITGDGLSFTGHVAALTVRDVRANASIVLGGTGTQATVLIARDIGDGGAIEATSVFKSVTAARIGNVTITAPRLDKLTVNGDKKSNISGAFSADVLLSGLGQDPAKPLLGGVAVAGLLSDAAWSIQGSVGAVAAGSIADFKITATGFIKSVTAAQWKDNDNTPDTIATPRLDKLNIKGDKKAGVAGDFEADLALSGLNQDPKKPALGGATIAGLLGDDGAATAWDIDGAAGPIVAGRIANANIDIAGLAKAITALEWKDSDATRDTLDAARLDKLNIKGDKKTGIAGDFEADLALSGLNQDPKKPVLGAAAIAGLLGRDMGNASWDIDGASGAIAAARIVNADIDVLTELKSIAANPARGSVTPTFVNSTVTAHTAIGQARLGLVQVLNNAEAFGLFAPRFKLVEYTPLGGVIFKLTPTTTLPVVDQDFSIAGV